MTEDKMIRCHHRLDGHESEQAPRVSDGQGSLACCSPWGHKASDTTERLNRTELKATIRMLKKEKKGINCGELSLGNKFLLIS